MNPAMNAVSAPPAGNSAERHFRSLRRRWRRRMAPTLAVASGAFFAAALMTARLLPWQPTFTAGVLAGGGLTLFLWAWDDPPEVIAKWGRGAAGERMTGKALRGLPADWYVRHDLQARYGNLDHVVVGPGGVFLLDSKNLGGRALVENGVLQVVFPNRRSTTTPARVSRARSTGEPPPCASASRRTSAGSLRCILSSFSSGSFPSVAPKPEDSLIFRLTSSSLGSWSNPHEWRLRTSRRFVASSVGYQRPPILFAFRGKPTSAHRGQ